MHDELKLLEQITLLEINKHKSTSKLIVLKQPFSNDMLFKHEQNWFESQNRQSKQEKLANNHVLLANFSCYFTLCDDEGEFKSEEEKKTIKEIGELQEEEEEEEEESESANKEEKKIEEGALVNENF